MQTTREPSTVAEFRERAVELLRDYARQAQTYEKASAYDRAADLIEALPEIPSR